MTHLTDWYERIAVRPAFRKAVVDWGEHHIREADRAWERSLRDDRGALEGDCGVIQCGGGRRELRVTADPVLFWITAFAAALFVGGSKGGGCR